MRFPIKMQWGLLAAVAMGSGMVQAMTADELAGKVIEAGGGRAALQAIQSVQASGKFATGGGIEAEIKTLTARPGRYRSELSLQGMTAIQAYDGAGVWAIQPFRGRKDPEKQSADELKVMQIQADIDGPLFDYASKGHKLEYLGTEDVDGTPAHKLRVLLATGNEQLWYIDPDFFLPIRVVDKIFRRGAESETETDLGDYEKVNGVYFPTAIQTGAKGAQADQKASISLDKIEVNVPAPAELFAFPEAKSKP